MNDLSNDGTGLRERLLAEAKVWPRSDISGLLREAAKALSAVAPPPVLEGWVLVPREPTPRMIDAFHAAGGLHGYHAAVKGGLRSAIATAASPAAPAQPEMQAAPVAWQPIETAPKGQHVIIACRLEDQWTVGEAWQHEYAGWWWVGTNPGDGRSFEMHPDFWQALPPPPTGE